jgi:hypothetical protein
LRAIELIDGQSVGVIDGFWMCAGMLKYRWPLLPLFRFFGACSWFGARVVIGVEPRELRGRVGGRGGWRLGTGITW